MDYVNLGKTGLKVSRICLGCMTYGAPATGELKARQPRLGPERRRKPALPSPGARSRNQFL